MSYAKSAALRMLFLLWIVFIIYDVLSTLISLDTKNRYRSDVNINSSITIQYPALVDKEESQTALDLPPLEHTDDGDNNDTNNSRLVISLKHLSWLGKQASVPDTQEVLIQPSSDPPSSCSDAGSLDLVVDYLLLIDSSVVHEDRRNTIRGELLHPQQNTDNKEEGRMITSLRMRVIFLTGTSSSDSASGGNAGLEKEAVHYGDILQGDFKDTHEMIPRKGIMGLQWVLRQQNCLNVSWVVRVGDEGAVGVLRHLREHHHFERKVGRKTHWMLGCFVKQEGLQLLKDQTRLAIEKTNVAGHTTSDLLEDFPFRYCITKFAILRGTVVRPLLRAVTAMPFAWIYNGYLFGLTPDTPDAPDAVDDVTYFRLTTSPARRQPTAVLCRQLYGEVCHVVAARQLWDLASSGTGKIVHLKYV